MTETASQKLAIAVADTLVGTASTLDNALSQHDAEDMQNDAEFTEALDAKVFCCDQCGWWADVEELHNEGDGQLCDECHLQDDEGDYE